MTWLARLWRARRKAVAVTLGIALVLALAGVFIWPVTDLIAAHDVSAITGQQRALHLQGAREAVRSQLLTLGAGIFVAGTLWFTARTYRLARQGQGHRPVHQGHRAARLGQARGAHRLCTVPEFVS